MLSMVRGVLTSLNFFQELMVRKKMKHCFLVFLCFLLCPVVLEAQEFEGVSGKVSLNITKDPPILSVVPGSLRFSDSDKNQTIDANESCKISFSVKNSGIGDGMGLTVELKLKDSAPGLVFSSRTPVDVIPVGQELKIELSVNGTMNTKDGSAVFVVKVDEPNGFGTDVVEIKVPTRAFESPLVQVTDYSVTSSVGGTLEKKKPFDVEVLIQNTQHGLAEDVKVSLVIPDNVLCLSGNEHQEFSTLASGETKSIVYSLIVAELYSSGSLPISIQLKERYNKFAENRTINLELDQSLSSTKLVVEATKDDGAKVDIEIASLTSEVDKNIPVSGKKYSNRYALAIGNEDYSSFQIGLSSEVNVDYALNDAKVFAEYCESTFGIPQKQVKLLNNATASQIRQGLSWLTNLMKLENGNAEVFFYYSGHGLPHEVTKEPYLIPVDVAGTNIEEGVKLSEVYAALTEFPSKRTTVFLDACFSGGARNQSLVAAKGVTITPKENLLSGNLVVFSSSSGEESSGVYREKQHGYFTYYFLKKLQESKGQISYGELSEYIKKSVQKETGLAGKIQTPQVRVSPKVTVDWEGWLVK